MPLPTAWMRRIAVILAAVPVLLAQDADLAERLYRSGERAYAAKNYSEAQETWKELIDQAPKSAYAAHALLDLARYQVDVRNKPEAALPLLDKIKSDHLKSPWAAEAMLLRGELLAARSRGPQDLKEAQAEFNRVVDLFPDHPCVQETRVQMGTCFRRTGQWSKAFQNYIEALRLNPGSDLGRTAQLQAAETLDLMGDLTGCLRMLQGLRDRSPDSAESADALWRLQVRVKQRLQKLPLRSQGPWPAGKLKWLKTPTLLATGPEGELYVFQDDLDRAALVKDGQAVPAGPVCRNAKAMLVPAPGQVWLVAAKLGVVKDDTAPAGWSGLQLQSPAGAAMDGWGNLWVCEPKASAIQVFGPDGPPRAVPLAGVVALAPLPTGGMAAASDSERALRFLDSDGRTRVTVPYGKDLPAPFRNVVALAADPLGHVAALVEGGFEGVALWGPDGTLLRSASFKTLGLSGRYRALALDRQGGIILADRSNDLLIRLD